MEDWGLLSVSVLSTVIRESWKSVVLLEKELVLRLNSPNIYERKDIDSG